MFYKKSQSKKLNFELFKNPTKEYRGAPFWAWNTKLEKDLLLEQIEVLKKMGFGGFFIHSRSGLNTEYLGKEFFEMVKSCRDKAENEDMLCYLYDEDKWPSGYGGGLVTKTPKYRQKMIYFTDTPKTFYDKEYAIYNALPYLLGVFDVVLDNSGYLISYKKIGENETAHGIKRYAYVEPVPCEAWHNGFTPEDAMNSQAVAKFIEVTYEKYKQEVGESFGTSIPAIFTDEPQMGFKRPLQDSKNTSSANFPWSECLSKFYFEKYGEDITDFIPELFLDFKDKISTARYRYHETSTELFTEAYSKQIGSWCNKNGILFTGHMMWEHNLDVQTETVGDATRAYEWFDIPGIDLLCNAVEIVTAKQTQSVVRQLNKDGFLTELYGVTNWDFDFRGHKFQGDWQAALGATLRVPHLSWVSMKGSAKRDYPASISYQVPWCEEYPYVEDHFARLNTVLTRGKPLVKVGVIHPIESFWLDYGANNTFGDEKKKAVKEFNDLCEQLYENTIDYDLISEALIERHASVDGASFNMGVMSYQTIIVPRVKTIRRETLNLLIEFRNNGGKLIFIDSYPACIDAIESNEGKLLYERSISVNFNSGELYNLLDSERTATIFNENGDALNNFVHQIRKDGDCKWFFMARFKNPQKDDGESQNVTIVFNGEYKPTLYDTVKGEISSIEYKTENGKTYIYKELFASDSLLIKLDDGDGCYKAQGKKANVSNSFELNGKVEYACLEENVLLVDSCLYKLNDGEFEREEEILKLDEKVRKTLNYPKADGWGVQPWALPDSKPENFVTLKYTFSSEDDIDNCFIAGEEATKITFNGNDVELTCVGYYVDKAIKKYKLGSIKKGLNELIIVTPITHRISVEYYYILGDFSVRVNGKEKTVYKSEEKITFSDITKQGFAFYGGNLVYKTKIETPRCDLLVKIPKYRNSLIKIRLDGEDKGVIAYAPFELTIENVERGEHILEILAYGNRVNTFGPLHDASHKVYISPSAWYTTGDAFTYGYELKETGILSSPIIKIIER